MEAKSKRKSCSAILRIDANSFCRFVDQDKRKLIDADEDDKSDSAYERVDEKLIDDIENITLEINANWIIVTESTGNEAGVAVGAEHKGQEGGSPDKNRMVMSVIHSALNSYVESSVGDLLLQLLRGEKYYDLPELVETFLELPIEVHGEGFIKVTNLLLKVTLVQPQRMLKFWIEVNRQRKKFLNSTHLLKDLVLSLEGIVKRKTYDDVLESDAQSEFLVTHEPSTEAKWRSLHLSNHTRAETAAQLISQLFRHQVLRVSKVMELMTHLSSTTPTADIVSMYLLVAIMAEIGDEFECSTLNECKLYSQIHEQEKTYKQMLTIYKKLSSIANYPGYKSKEGYWLQMQSRVIIFKKQSSIIYLKKEIKRCVESAEYASFLSSEEANLGASRSSLPLPPVAPTENIKIETSTAHRRWTANGGSICISPRRLKERFPDSDVINQVQSQSGERNATFSRMVDNQEARTKL